MGRDARRSALYRYLNSDAVMIACAYKADKKRPRYMRHHILQLMATVRHWDWENPPTTPERILITNKPSGGFRVIYDPSLLRRAAFTAISSILHQHLVLRDFQYDYKGVDCAIENVISLIKDGFVYVQHLDIKNYFGSFDKEKLIKELPLPKGVVERWVMASAMPVDLEDVKAVGTTSSLHSLLDVAHQGIPLGSSASAVIALLNTSTLDWDAPEGVRLINYADNFLVLGKSQESAEAAGQAVRASIKGLLGGHFSAKEYAACHVGEGFVFLGHAICRINDAITVNPTAATESAFWNNICEYEAKILRICDVSPLSAERIDDAKMILCDMYVYAQSWAGSFRVCDSAASNFEHVKCVVKKFCDSLGIEQTFLATYRNPEAKYKWFGSSP